MSRSLGMDPDRVTELLVRVQAQLSSLDQASTTASEAARLSLSPLTYGVQPGGLLLAPFSIGGTQLASALVRAARLEAESLIEGAFGDVSEQRRVSATNGSLPSVGVTRPQTDSGRDPQSGSWWNGVVGALEVLEFIEDVHGQIDFAHDLTWFARKVQGLPFVDMARALPWKDTALPWLRNPGVAGAVSVGGKALGVIGIGFGVADIVTGVMEDDPWKAGWGAFNVVVGIGSFLPPPAGPIIAGVGLLANAGKWVYENWDGITEFASNAVDAVGTAARVVDTAVRETVGAVVDTVGAAGKALIEGAKSLWPW